MPKIFFDLEGPISPQDNAYEVLGLAKNGGKVFEVISRYDDILTLEGREGYEPGDTLKLIVPFLVYNQISECDINKVTKKADLVPGIKETIAYLKKEGWDVYIISTSYQQHAHNIAGRVGIDAKNVACTRMPLDDYLHKFSYEDLKIVAEMEEKILNELYGKADDEKIKAELDRFFFEEIPKSGLGEIFNEIDVVGGQKKVDAMMKFAGGEGLADAIAVGDSITDFKMLEKISGEGGLGIVFNGNEYSVPYADVAVATVDQRFLLPVISAFREGGVNGAISAVENLESAPLDEILSSVPEDAAGSIPENISPPRYHRVGSNTDDIIKIHKEYRTLLRGEAGKLG